MIGKFIQIATDTDSLYALDAEGQVWELVYQAQWQGRRWIPLPTKREPQEEEKP